MRRLRRARLASGIRPSEWHYRRGDSPPPDQAVRRREAGGRPSGRTPLTREGDAWRVAPALLILRTGRRAQLPDPLCHLRASRRSGPSPHRRGPVLRHSVLHRRRRSAACRCGDRRLSRTIRSRLGRRVHRARDHRDDSGRDCAWRRSRFRCPRGASRVARVPPTSHTRYRLDARRRLEHRPQQNHSLVAGTLLTSVEIRRVILDRAHAAREGHIGSALSIADIMVVLYRDVVAGRLRGKARDRVVLSKGHAALALYAALYLSGELSEELLAEYCEDGGRLGVHPQHGIHGVEFTTGSLGQGLSL